MLAGEHASVVSELLRRRLRDPDSLPADAREGYRHVLDHLVAATQLRHPVIGDLARQVRYRSFDAPLIAAERIRVQQDVRTELDRLSDDPEIRAAQIDYLVVDLRISQSLPTLGVYIETGEYEGRGRTEPVPAAALEKFAAVPGVDRIYDSGTVQIYDVRRLRDAG